MICMGLSSVCCSSTTASKTKLSRNVPGTGIAFNPVNVGLPKTLLFSKR
jgi:hypothetical protein